MKLSRSGFKRISVPTAIWTRKTFRGRGSVTNLKQIRGFAAAALPLQDTKTLLETIRVGGPPGAFVKLKRNPPTIEFGLKGGIAKIADKHIRGKDIRFRFNRRLFEQRITPPTKRSGVRGKQRAFFSLLGWARKRYRGGRISARVPIRNWRKSRLNPTDIRGAVLILEGRINQFLRTFRAAPATKSFVRKGTLGQRIDAGQLAAAPQRQPAIEIGEAAVEALRAGRITQAQFEEARQTFGF